MVKLKSGKNFFPLNPPSHPKWVGKNVKSREVSRMEETIISDHGIENLIARMKTYLGTVNESRVRKAFDFAKKAHGTQRRDSGKPYIIHPFKTAEILVEMNADEDTIIAGLLHDVVEDTTYDLEDVKRRFEGNVAYLVDGVTKLPKRYNSHEKLFAYAAKDKRVMLIKLADRLHNMRTLHFIQDRDRQKKIAQETADIYIPVATFLKLNRICDELKRLCSQYLM